MKETIFMEVRESIEEAKEVAYNLVEMEEMEEALHTAETVKEVLNNIIDELHNMAETNVTNIHAIREMEMGVEIADEYINDFLSATNNKYNLVG